MMFNFNHLYYFYVTAKYGGVTKAARYLRIAQPSLSAQLHTLENMLDVKLFRREGRIISLTEEGLCVFGYCQKMFDSAEELKSYLTKGRNIYQSTVTIAIANEVARRLSTDLVSRLILSNKRSAARIRMISGAHVEVMEWMQKREVDAVITNHYPDREGTHIIREIISPVYLYGGADIASMTSSVFHLEVQDLLKKIELGLVLPCRGVAMREEIDQYIMRNTLQNPIAFESDILQACIQAVQDGVGVGFFPELYVQHESLNEKLFRIGPERSLWLYKIYLATYAGTENENWLNPLKLRFDDMDGEVPQFVEKVGNFQYMKK